MVRPREFDTQIAIDQALSIFRKQGYKGSSLQDLIRAMGISKSSFYETFGSKHALFLMTLTRFRETKAVYHFTDPNNNTPAKTLITNMFMQLIDSVIDGEGGCMFGSSAIEFSDTDPEVTERITNGIQQLEKMFYRLLILEQKNGDVLENKSIRVIARQLTTTFYGIQVMANANFNREELNEIALKAISMLD